MCPFDYTAVAVSGKVWPVNQVNHTSWVAVVTSTDRHKSVRNRCVIELFFASFVLSFCPFDISVVVWAFVIGLSQISSFFYEILYRWSTRGLQHTLMLFGQMCHQWWSHLFLIGSITSIQLLLGFQRNTRSQLCAFHVVPYTKMTGQVFDWLTHFPILSNRYTEWPGIFCSEFGSVLRTQSQCQIVPFFPKGGQKWPLCCRLPKWKLLSTNI